MNCNQEDHRNRKISVRGRKVCIEEDRRKADGCKIRTKEENISRDYGHVRKCYQNFPSGYTWLYHFNIHIKSFLWYGGYFCLRRFKFYIFVNKYKWTPVFINIF